MAGIKNQLNNNAVKNTMSEREGVIKYQLSHQYAPLPAQIDTVELNAWRQLLQRLQLIGQAPDRYDGLGFGNVSQRLIPGENQFVITGTQTGHLPHLKPEHFAVILDASPNDNCLQALGPTQPSSEALTHASVYQNLPGIQAVVHVHSPEIWRHTDQLSLPHTAGDIPYGSVAMAKAVEKLLMSGQLRERPIFAMLGHQDGIVALGESLAAATSTLLEQLARAIAIEQCHSDS